MTQAKAQYKKNNWLVDKFFHSADEEREFFEEEKCWSKTNSFEDDIAFTTKNYYL